jgi:hypothetical protein
MSAREQPIEAIASLQNDAETAGQQVTQHGTIGGDALNPYCSHFLILEQ